MSLIKIGLLLIVSVVLSGCLMSEGYYAREAECERQGETDGKFIDHPLRACTQRLLNQGFASDLDPKYPQGTYRPVTLESLSGGLLTTKPQQPQVISPPPAEEKTYRCTERPGKYSRGTFDCR